MTASLSSILATRHSKFNRFQSALPHSWDPIYIPVFMTACIISFYLATNNSISICHGVSVKASLSPYLLLFLVFIDSGLFEGTPYPKFVTVGSEQDYSRTVESHWRTQQNFFYLILHNLRTFLESPRLFFYNYTNLFYL